MTEDVLGLLDAEIARAVNAGGEYARALAWATAHDAAEYVRRLCEARRLYAESETARLAAGAP